MPRTLPQLLALVCLAFAALSAEAQPLNTPVDQDSDGQPDYVLVGDWDGDGQLTTCDAALAVGALSDPDGNVVELTAGHFQAPADPGHPGDVDAPCPGLSQGRGLVELPSYFTLRGQGMSATKLSGPGIAVNENWSIVTNADFANGNTNVVVEDLEIDGGFGGTYDCSGCVTIRMGVFYKFVTDGVVRRSYIHDTLHSCLYDGEGTGVVYEDNVIDRCGGFGNTDPDTGISKAGVYVFTGLGSTNTGHISRRNVISRTRGQGLNSRRQVACEGPGPECNGNAPVNSSIENLTWEDNFIFDNNASVGPGSDPRPCLTVAGVRGAVVRRNECVGTDGVILGAGAGGYRTENYHWSSIADVLFEDNLVRDSHFSSRGAAIGVGPYSENLTLLNNEVRDIFVPGVSCLRVEHPHRNLLVSGMLLQDCAGEGLDLSGVGAAGVAPDESETYRDITIRRTGALKANPRFLAGGVQSLAPIFDSSFENFSISDAGTRPFSVAAAFSGNQVVTFDVDATPAGYAGERTLAEFAAEVCRGANGWTEDGDAATLVDAEAAWSDGEFDDGFWFVEILTGPALGNLREIVNTDATAQAVGVIPDFSSPITAGVAYSITHREESRWFDVTGTNGTCDGGGGSQVSACVCDGGRFAPRLMPGGDVIEFHGDHPVSGNLFQDVIARNGRDKFGVTLGNAIATGNTFIGIDAISENANGAKMKGALLLPTQTGNSYSGVTCTNTQPGPCVAFVCINDADFDHACDSVDNCPQDYNPDQADSDADGTGDVCEDDDLDLDGISDPLDNCSIDPNPTQVDTDVDGYGNACDADYDNSGSVASFDFNRMRGAFGAFLGEPDYERVVDFDDSGYIGIADFNFFRQHLYLPPGPSGLACAGTVPCPAN